MAAQEEMQNDAPSQSKVKDDIEMLGDRIKHYKASIKSLKAKIKRLDDLIRDMQASLGEYHSASEQKVENLDLPHDQSEEETIGSILRHGNSAAGILCQLKTHHQIQASKLPWMTDVVGIVATLGKLEDDNISRLLAAFLGVETMLAVVCKTETCVRALETYDKEGSIDKNSGLHGLGTSIGRPLHDQFLVICLENMRPYTGDFIADDPQRRLDLPKPKLPNGETPPGFLGFAVNLICINCMNLYYVTTNGHGLRETLFYRLFSSLQVYKTREDMLRARPLISNGAISLDGGMIRNRVVFSLGNRKVMDVKFPKVSGKSHLPDNYFEIEKKLKEAKWKKERLLEDMRREEALLDQSKFHYKVKKQEFVKFPAESSPYAAAQMVNRRQHRDPQEDLFDEYSERLHDRAVKMSTKSRTATRMERGRRSTGELPDPKVPGFHYELPPQARPSSSSQPLQAWPNRSLQPPQTWPSISSLPPQAWPGSNSQLAVRQQGFYSGCPGLPICSGSYPSHPSHQAFWLTPPQPFQDRVDPNESDHNDGDDSGDGSNDILEDDSNSSSPSVAVDTLAPQGYRHQRIFQDIAHGAGSLSRSRSRSSSRDEARQHIPVECALTNVSPWSCRKDIAGPSKERSMHRHGPVEGTGSQPFEPSNSPLPSPPIEEQIRVQAAPTPAVTRRRGGARGSSEDWRLRGPAPGGPQDPSLIPSFTGHAAAAIWNGTERPVLTCHTRTHLLSKWKEVGFAAQQCVMWTGLHHLGNCMFNYVNMPLLSAFVERWQPDTNSFHMPFGEMTITLHDVHYILRIPVNGQVVAHGLTRDEVLAQISECLRLELDYIKPNVDKGGIKFTDLKEIGCDSDIAPRDAAKAFVAYLLGGTLFVDKSQDRTPYHYWPMLQQLDAVGTYAWGAACLAYLYRQLGTASRADCKQLAGCMTLLEAWVYCYFPMFCPAESPTWKPGQPHALRWSSGRPTSKTFDSLREYRMRLDALTAREVSWTPFGTDVLSSCKISSFHGCIRYCDVVEPYMPDRCLRQFGNRQRIPIAPFVPQQDYRPANPRMYIAKYPDYDTQWMYPDSHVLSRHQLGDRAVPPMSTSSDYVEWFLARTHPRVQNPVHLPANIPTVSPFRMTDVTRMDLMTQILDQFEKPHKLTDNQLRSMVSEAYEVIKERKHSLTGERRHQQGDQSFLRQHARRAEDKK